MKKKFLSLLLALVMCLGLLPVTASAAEGDLPDWYFLFAIFKNVDANGKDKNGKSVHVKHSMPQDEIDFAKALAKDFETYMSQVGVMRAHVEIMEIDAVITDLGEYSLGSWLSPTQAAPILQDKVDLDQYDHVVSYVSLKDLSVSWMGLTGDTFENGTGMSCINLNNRKLYEKFPSAAEVHEFLHFGERLSKKWGADYRLHDIVEKFYPENVWKIVYTDIIINQAKGTAGTGVHPAVWQYPPHVMRTMSELTIPSSVTGIGKWAFQGREALVRVSIPSSVTSIEVAAFQSCTSLTSVSLPTSITRVEDYTFANCPSLTDVYYSGTEAQWKAIQIGEYNEALTRANIHYNHLMADVKTTDWFAQPVMWAVEKGITAGTGNGGFSPNSTCTQAQILTFLWRAYGSQEPAGKVSGSEYYAVPLQWAREQGVISGSLDPNSPCTRSDVVTYLWKLAGSPAAKAASFSDVPASASYAGAVSWAVEQGITSGTGAGKFSPNSTCTRGQIVTFLRAALEK